MAQKQNSNAAPQKRIPVRQCLGCNEHKPKRELLRVVRDPEGQVSLDFTGKKSGRGAYICKDVKCLKKVRKSGRLAKNLECEISDEVYTNMERELAEGGDVL
ncbi:MAG: YlxR family protein [Ruminococcaceae bacterium]|nr:YlxR family protein [Oscillospiraceae bacterium]